MGHLEASANPRVLLVSRTLCSNHDTALVLVMAPTLRGGVVNSNDDGRRQRRRQRWNVVGIDIFYCRKLLGGTNGAFSFHDYGGLEERKVGSGHAAAKDKTAAA